MMFLSKIACCYYSSFQQPGDSNACCLFATNHLLQHFFFTRERFAEICQKLDKMFEEASEKKSGEQFMGKDGSFSAYVSVAALRSLGAEVTRVWLETNLDLAHIDGLLLMVPSVFLNQNEQHLVAIRRNGTFYCRLDSAFASDDPNAKKLMTEAEVRQLVRETLEAKVKPIQKMVAAFSKAPVANHLEQSSTTYSPTQAITQEVFDHMCNFDNR